MLIFMSRVEINRLNLKWNWWTWTLNSLEFQSKTTGNRSTSNQNRTSTVLIVFTIYFSCTIRMPSQEFARICKDLSNIGESVQITVTKGGVTFSAKGDIGNAKINLTQGGNVDKEEESIVIDMQEAVNLTFALRFVDKIWFICKIILLIQIFKFLYKSHSTIFASNPVTFTRGTISSWVRHRRYWTRQILLGTKDRRWRRRIDLIWKSFIDICPLPNNSLHDKFLG